MGGVGGIAAVDADQPVGVLVLGDEVPGEIDLVGFEVREVGGLLGVFLGQVFAFDLVALAGKRNRLLLLGVGFGQLLDVGGLLQLAFVLGALFLDGLLLAVAVGFTLELEVGQFLGLAFGLGFQLQSGAGLDGVIVHGLQSRVGLVAAVDHLVYGVADALGPGP